MKKTHSLALAILLLLSTTAMGQTNNSSYMRDYNNSNDNFVEKTRSTMDGLFSSSTTSKDDDEDVVKVKGAYYMPIYNVNLYKGANASNFRSECQWLFLRRFPQAKITSSALPQTEWVSESVIQNKTVVGYTQTMYCYIIAKDGNDGYINARFAYKRYKDVGKSYTPLADYWPKWERTDYLTPEVYKKLLDK